MKNKYSFIGGLFLITVQILLQSCSGNQQTQTDNNKIETLISSMPAQAQPGENGGLFTLVEVDSESGAEIYMFEGDERPSDPTYGEPPYGDATGRRIAIRYHSLPDKPGGITIFDLQDGSSHEIFSGIPSMPAMHAWGEWLYYYETLEGKKILRRCNYLSLKSETVAELPPDRGIYSYGTVSPDLRYYAVSVQAPGAKQRNQVHLLDLKSKQWSIILNKSGYFVKHEQFSRDGRNRVLIQQNKLPDTKVVLLSELDINGNEKRFPADQPYTLVCTGHEAWIGNSSRILFTTGMDTSTNGNLWSGKVGDEKATLVFAGKSFMHVSVSRDGNYWVADIFGGDDVPIYVGSFKSGRVKRICLSHTEYDGKQWSHTHPYLTADNKWLIFGARRNGQQAQVYGAKLKEGWLKSL